MLEETSTANTTVTIAEVALFASFRERADRPIVVSHGWFMQ
jgi:hypothetical protein